MSKSVKGTKTEEALLAAFAGEAQARNRYTYFASTAEKEGFLQIAEIFRETAENEKEHAKLFFKHLEGGMVTIHAAYPAGTIGTTADNLKAAAEGEHEEWSKLYPDASQIAREEGFPDIAATFENVAGVESHHEARYLKLYANIRNGEVFKKNTEIRWKCRNCGHIHTGTTAPDTCPVCKHPQRYFEMFVETY